jgi:single-strand DNA-binding protein
MLNTITIHGRLTQDVELKQTQSGVSVCNFTVAVDRYYSKGEDKITDFFTVVCWRGLADMVSKYFGKGKEIIVSGEMQSRKWQDNDGNNRVSWEIQANTVDFCGSKVNNTPTTENAKQVDLDVIVDNGSDDLPF